MSGNSAAFMSYVRFNDDHDDGLLTQLRERLGTEVRAQTGEEFSIFQDRNDVAWGQNWQQRIDEALDEVTLLLVIITPSLFRSPACRAEVARFLEREAELGRPDLILPLYYISARELDDPVLREADEVARVLASRQFADWRELRFEPFTSPLVRRALAQLASRMRDAFWHPPAVALARFAGAEEAMGAEAGPTEQLDGTANPALTAKAEPPTHVVDPYHRGDFTTVSAAINAARPGDRILVRPGLYEEGLVVDKPLEILGDGPVADIEIRAREAPALMFRTSIGRVTNMTLRQTGGKWYGVDITQGRLELEGCDISSQGIASVLIRNGADPRLRRNQIHDGTAGVFVCDNGLGTLEDNDIADNTMSGVAIKNGNPTLRRNQIRDNKAAGVFVYDNGLGTLEDNDIAGNTMSGVAIKTGGNPTLRRNQIHYNKQAGVVVTENGLGTLEDNDIAGNTSAGVSIKMGANPTLRGNRIRDGKKSGVVVTENGLGTLEDNDITGNTAAGVAIQAGGNPTLRANRINRNAYEAVRISEGGCGIFEGNDLTANTGGAWRIAKECEENATRSRNKE